MKQELVGDLFQKFEQSCYLYNELECWSARELPQVLGYAEWRNFLKVVEKVKIACANAGFSVADHFVDIEQNCSVGKETKRNCSKTSKSKRDKYGFQRTQQC